MKRSFLLVFVVVLSFAAILSLTTLFSIPAAQAVPAAADTAVGPTSANQIDTPAIVTEPHILLQKNTAYYDAASVAISDVTSIFIDPYLAWSRYQGGEFDTIELPKDLISEVVGLPVYASQLVTTTMLRTKYYGFSMDVPPMDNPLVRAAFATALDRQQLINGALPGDEQPTLTFSPPGAFGYVDGYAMGVGHPYSPTLAASLLASSGYTGMPTITLMVDNRNNETIMMAEAARQMWFNALGVSVTLRVEDWGTHLDILTNGAAADRPAIYLLGWGADYPDANNFLNDGVLGMNYSRYFNPDYEAIVFAAAAETNSVTRANLYKQAESYLVMTDTAMSPLYNDVAYELTRPALSRTYRSFGGQHMAEWSFAAPQPLEVAWGDPHTLDPALANDKDAINYVDQLFLGLTDYDPVTNQVVPELATSWNVAPDGLVYTFTLRSDALWTDGNQVTAYDVEYGVMRSLDPATGSEFGSFLLAPVIQQVQALDATHVRFKLYQPAVYFPALLANWAARPQPQWTIDTYGVDWTKPGNIVSNGPYQLVEWQSSPHVRVEKFGEGPPAASGHLGFRIKYWNDGGAPADNVVITDTLVSGMTFITDTGPFGSSGIGTISDPLVWNLGTLSPYSYGEFEVFVLVTAVQSQTITNTVQITTTTPNNQGQFWEREMGWNDVVRINDTHLSITKSLQTPAIAPGVDLTYVLDVCNDTPTGATASDSVTITDTLHPSLTFKSWWTQSNLFWDDSQSSGQTLVLKRPSLPGYFCDQIFVMAQVDPAATPGQQIDNSVVITANNDLESGDNTATHVGSVVDFTNLTLNKAAYPDPVIQNQPLTYTLSIVNSSPVTATNIILTDTLPVAVIFVQAMPGSPVCIENSGTVVCSLGDIPPSGVAFVDILVMPSIPGEIINYAAVSSFEYDADPVDNFASVATFVAPPSTDPIILSIDPTYGFNDVQSSFIITGFNFQPGAVALLDGTLPLATTFLADTTLQADVPPGLAPDTYDVWVINPDSATDILLYAFTVIENQPPAITAVSPPQGPSGIPVVIDIFGSNFVDGSAATLSPGFYPLNMIFIDSTHLRAIVSPLVPTGLYTVEVANPNETFGQLPNAYEVFDTAVHTDLFAEPFDFWRSPLSIRMDDPITPYIGLDVRRQGGAATLPSVDVDFYLGAPGGTFIGRSQALSLAPNNFQTTIPLAWMPPGAGQFTLYAVIDPDNAVTEMVESNNIVSRTITVLPPLPADVTPPLITDFNVNGGVDHTSQRQVTLNITATDEIGGSGVLSLLYVEYEYNQSIGDWVPVQMSDWLPYSSANVDYPWALLPSAGLHYLQAWVADGSGNISAPFSRFISYQPDSVSIAPGQVHVYRKILASGDGLTVRLTILDGGTVDLYVWKPDATLVEVHEGVTSFQEITVNADQDGVYQIEVEGQTSAEYKLEFVFTAGAPPAADPLAIGRILRARSTPFFLPDDEPGDDAGLPSPPSNNATIMLPIVIKN